MMDKGLMDKLAKIGYTALWLDFGVLTVDQLSIQEHTFDRSDDPNTEHYRYNTFKHYLSSKDTLTDIEFDNYLMLTFEDNDILMASSAAVDLFNSVDLTNEQFEKLCKAIRHFGEWTEKVVIRQTLLRKLRTNKLTNELFLDCITKGDSIIQEYILDIANLGQLEELAINGKNKSIRNIATEKFRTMTKQKNSR